MAEGGFVVKFDNKQIACCYAASFDYDEWTYIINNKEPKALPPTKIKKITIEIEYK